MKKETGEYIFQLLKAFIFKKEPVLTGDPDWDEVFYCSKIHAVNGIIGYIVTQYSLCGDDALAAQFEKEMIHTYGYQYRRKVQMEKLISILNEHEIDHLLMKGFLVKNLYPVPELRWYGDIDFVIHKEDRAKTDELMRNLGYVASDNWEPVFTYKKDSEYYEIHTEILDAEIGDGKQREYFHEMWDHSVCVHQHTYQFEKEYHFAYLIAHLAKHASKKGAGIRMYLDIALFIKEYRDSVNWDEILKYLDELGLRRFFYTVCTACDQWYGIEPPCSIDAIDPMAFEMFTEMTFEGGTFGFSNPNDAIEALKETDASQSRLKTVMDQIFPSADEIQARYTYLQKHRWLLPVAWVDRVFRNRNLLGKRINMAKEILDVDENEVKQIRDLNKEIGL